MSFDEVTTVITGMLLDIQVDLNIIASKLGSLDKSDLNIIKEINKQHSFFVSGIRPATKSNGY